MDVIGANLSTSLNGEGEVLQWCDQMLLHTISMLTTIITPPAPNCSNWWDAQLVEDALRLWRCVVHDEVIKAIQIELNMCLNTVCSVFERKIIIEGVEVVVQHTLPIGL